MTGYHRKVYLGDGVYVAFDGVGLVLTTENGIEVQNTVYLESEVFVALVEYEATLRDWIKQQKSKTDV